MGSTSSSEKKSSKKNNARLYNLINVQSDYNTEQNTINFSRRDLLNTLSDKSILDVMHTGGGNNVYLNKKPNRDRYSQYETQNIKNKNQNLIGAGAKTQDQFSSVSAAEFNELKQLVMRGAGCGCAENSVLNMNGGNRCSLHNLSDASIYNPLNSITMSDASQQYGGNCGNGVGSATSSFMPSQVGSAIMTATSVSDDAPVAEVNLGSVTSVFDAAPIAEVNLNSATSSYMPSQVGSAIMTATSVSDAAPNDANIQNAELTQNSVNSNINRLQKLTNVLMGGNVSSVSSVSMSPVSRTSENAVNYHDLVGGAGEDTVTDGESSSTTTTESTTTIDENSESTAKHSESRLARLASASKSKTESTRSSKASSTSSSGTSYSSSSSHGGSSSSTSRRTSATSSSSSSTSTESHSLSMSRNIYLSSSMSDGNIINAKQFYSSDHGQLYSSDTNYLRHNLTKRRFR